MSKANGNKARAARVLAPAVLEPPAVPPAKLITVVELRVRYNYATDTVEALECSVPEANVTLLHRVLLRATDHVLHIVLGQYNAVFAALQEARAAGAAQKQVEGKI